MSDDEFKEFVYELKKKCTKNISQMSQLKIEKKERLQQL